MSEPDEPDVHDPENGDLLKATTDTKAEPLLGSLEEDAATQSPSAPITTEGNVIPGYSYPKESDLFARAARGRRYTAFGLTKTLPAWAHLFRVSYATLYPPLHYGPGAALDKNFLLECILRRIFHQKAVIYSVGSEPAREGHLLGDKHQSQAEWEQELGLPPDSLNGLVWYRDALRESLDSPPIPKPAE